MNARDAQQFSGSAPAQDLLDFGDSRAGRAGGRAARMVGVTLLAGVATAVVPLIALAGVAAPTSGNEGYGTQQRSW